MIIINVYIITTICVLLLGVLYKYKFKISIFNTSAIVEGKNVYLFITFVIMTLIMALRSPEVGVDTAPYTRIFNTIANSDSVIDAITNAPLTAPVYVLICYLLSLFNKDPQIMIIFSSIFVNLGLWIFIKKKSINPIISVFCWIGLSLYYCSMNGNRQCMALVLTLNALVYLSDNIKSIKGWLLIITAVGIHSTSLIICIAIAGILLTEKVKNTLLIFYISFGMSTVISIGYSSFVKLFIKFFPWYSMYNNGESSYSIIKGSGGGRIIVIYLFLLLICFLWLFTYKTKQTDIDEFHKKMLPALIFGAVFGIFNCKNELINRILWFYTSIYITFIPCSLKKYRKIGYLFTIVVVIALFAYSILTLLENQNGVVPYKTFW